MFVKKERRFVTSMGNLGSTVPGMRRAAVIWLVLSAGCRSRPEPTPVVQAPARDGAVTLVARADAAPAPAIVEPTWFDEVEAFHDGLARVRRDQLWGYLGTDGRLVVPIAFDRLDHFDAAVAWAHGPDGFHIARRNKDIVISAPIAATAVMPFAGGVAMVQDHDGWRLIAATGKDVIATRFSSVDKVADGCAVWSVTSAGKACVVGPRGTCIAATSRPDGLIIADEAGKVGTVSCAGDVVVAPAYDEIVLTRGWARIKQDGMWGLADPTGRVVVPPRFLSIGELDDNGIAFVAGAAPSGKRMRGLFAQPDHIVEPTWQELRAPSEGRVAVRGDAGWGFVTLTNETIAKPELDEVLDVHEHLAAFRKGDKWGVLDDRGAVVIAPTYDHVGTFANGLAVVQLANAFGMIDRAGAIVLPIEYAHAIAPEHGLGEAERALGHPYAKGDYVCVAPGKNAKSRAVEFTELGELHGDRVAARWRDKLYCSYLDASCNPVGEQHFQSCGAFDRAGYAIATNLVDGAYGAYVIDHDLNQVADASYLHEEAENARLADGIFKVRGKDDRIGVLDKGAVTIPTAYEDAGYFGEGFVAVARGGTWGFFSLDGTPLVARSK
jgi:WG containing repeat